MKLNKLILGILCWIISPFIFYASYYLDNNREIIPINYTIISILSAALLIVGLTHLILGCIYITRYFLEIIEKNKKKNATK